MTRPIYLDYQATTPLAPEAREAMQPYLGERFGNPHSPHFYGREADAAIEYARSKIAAVIEADPAHLYYTAGATEAVNWALKGVLTAPGQRRRRLVTIATEHACVLDTSDWLQGLGIEVVRLPVDARGLVDVDQAIASIDEKTALVSIMAVNNEIGVTQPLAALSRRAREVGARVHVDAAQSFGKLATSLADCDLLSISAHKIYGPKGIGALWVRPGVEITPLIHGGGQEGRGRRSGTLAPALCAGFGAAAALARDQMVEDSAHVQSLWDMAMTLLPGPFRINGDIEARWRGNLNIEFPGCDSGRLISEVRGVAFSAGSACASGSGRPSHVLSALGVSAAAARSSIRLGWGRYTSMDDIKTAFEMIGDAVSLQRNRAA